MEDKLNVQKEKKALLEIICLLLLSQDEWINELSQESKALIITYGSEGIWLNPPPLVKWSLLTCYTLQPTPTQSLHRVKNLRPVTRGDPQSVHKTSSTTSTGAQWVHLWSVDVRGKTNSSSDVRGSEWGGSCHLTESVVWLVFSSHLLIASDCQSARIPLFPWRCHAAMTLPGSVG